MTNPRIPVEAVGAHRFADWATRAVRSIELLRRWFVGRAPEDDEAQDERGAGDEAPGSEVR